MELRRPRLPQLRSRVLASVLAITLVALAAFGIAAVTALHRYLVTRTDSQLQSVVSLYRPAHLPPPGRPFPERPGKPSFQKRSVIAVPPPRWLPAVLDQYGVTFVSGHGPRALLAGNPDLVPRFPRWADVSVPAAGQHTQTVISRNGHAQLRLLAIPARGRTLVASTSLGQVNSTVGRLELILTIGSLAAGLLVFLGVAWVMRRGLRPIETMAAQADRITAGDLTDRVSPHDLATEVGRLGTALNGMLTASSPPSTSARPARRPPGASSPTPATNCATRWPPCAPTPSSTSKAPSPAVPRSTRPCTASPQKPSG